MRYVHIESHWRRNEPITRMVVEREGRYGRRWVILEIVLFLLLCVLTVGAFFVGFLFENLSAHEESKYAWERRNHAGFVKYASTLKGRYEIMLVRFGLWLQTKAVS